jgi:hypothetical protein
MTTQVLQFVALSDPDREAAGPLGAVERLVHARWTDEIHAEWIRSLTANNPAIPIGKVHAARDLMNAVLPDAMVKGYQDRLSGITLPDANDCHVFAAGLAAGASLIVTWNLRDDPDWRVGPWGAAPAAVNQRIPAAGRTLRGGEGSAPRS